MDTAVQMPSIDAEGYLIEPQDWNEDLAAEFARQENIQLSNEHWMVVNFMREYFEEHQVAPDARFVIKHLNQNLEGASRNKLFELFPYGYVKQACKIAGMKRPRAWSTG